MNEKIISLTCGIIFGIGLVISGMTNPSKVISFLSITHNWDASLIFVMGGAIIVTAPMFYLLRNNENSTITQTYMSQLFIYNSLEIINNKAKEIILSISSENEKLGLLKSLNEMTRYLKYPNIVNLKTKIADSVIKENKYCF